MPDQEFLFEVDLPDEARFDDMVMALAMNMLGHLGYPSGAATETLAGLHAELARGAAGGGRRCHIQIRAAGGEMQITVCYANGPEWRIRRPLP